MRRWGWLGAFGAAVLVMVATIPMDGVAQACPKGKLRIYTSWPMQGAMIPEGTGMKNGLDMAIAETGGVVAGYCLEIVNLDDASPQTGKWDGAVEAENANKAVADPLAILYVGTYNSGAAKVSIPINNRAHMAQITPANTYPGLTKKQGAAPGEPEIYRPLGFVNYFRPIPADDIQGAVAAKWAKRLGVKKVFILNDQELYGKGIADVFEATAKKIGLPWWPTRASTGSSPTRSPSSPRCGLRRRPRLHGRRHRNRRAGHHPPDEGSGTGRPARPLHGAGRPPRGGASERSDLRGGDGHRHAGDLRRPALREDEGVGAKTYEEYKKKFGKEPTAYALYAAEGGRVAVEALKRAAPEIDRAKDITEKREALRKAISLTKNFEGINGKWSFDANGDVDYDTMSGFKVVKSDGPIGCKFQFEAILE
jgi:ABC-type branched-chain amino acid transport systems, periplasmic component